jgi:hypothetical protein
MNPFLLREALEKLARKIEVPVPTSVRAAPDISRGVTHVLRQEGTSHPWAGQFGLENYKSKVKGVRRQASKQAALEKMINEARHAKAQEVLSRATLGGSAADDLAKGLDAAIQGSPSVTLGRRVVEAGGKKPGFLSRMLGEMRGKVVERIPTWGARAGLVGIGLGGAYAYKKIRERRDSKRDFEKMMLAHPALKHEDPSEVEKRYKTLRHVAPVIANDPFASGSVIKQWIEYPTVSATTLLDAAKVQQAAGKGLDLLKVLNSLSGSLGD